MNVVNNTDESRFENLIKYKPEVRKYVGSILCKTWDNNDHYAYAILLEENGEIPSPPYKLGDAWGDSGCTVSRYSSGFDNNITGVNDNVNMGNIHVLEFCTNRPEDNVKTPPSEMKIALMESQLNQALNSEINKVTVRVGDNGYPLSGKCILDVKVER